MWQAQLALVLVVYAVSTCADLSVRSSAPQFSDHYYVEGVLALPYAEIKEPFIGYFDGPNNRSRIDYYGDLVMTYQRGDLEKDVGGINFKLAYMVDTDGDAQRVCFRVNGTNEDRVSAQSVLPDLTPFTQTGSDACTDDLVHLSDKTCERWEYQVTRGDRNNKYVFWLTRDGQSNPIPVQYLMYGYDSLLGSHYDKYEVYYKNYRTTDLDPNVYAVPQNTTCRSFPGPGLEHIGQHNPIKEFINGVDSHVDQEFDKFTDDHNKRYANQTHERQRKNIFRQNLRYILSKNRESIHYRLAVNHLADMSDNELKIMRGKLYSGDMNNGLPFDKTKYNISDIPNQWDWRLLGAVNPVKDQAVCGSCWSFGTTGTIEGVYFVKTGHLVRFSEQQLIDCSWNEGDDGCDGGEDFRAYEYIMKVNGLSTEEDYGDYLGQDGRCHDKAVKKSVRLNGFFNVTTGDVQALEAAIYYNGPVTVAIDASHKGFSFYSHGVYYEPQCGNKPEDMDHQVLAVGFGTLQNQRYWLIKNSWSTYWGNDGYILMSQKDNNCGVTTEPTFPIIAD